MYIYMHYYTYTKMYIIYIVQKCTSTCTYFTMTVYSYMYESCMNCACTSSCHSVHPQHVVRVKKIDDEEEEGGVLTEEEIMDLAQGTL